MPLPIWLEKAYRSGRISIADAFNVSHSSDPAWKTLISEMGFNYSAAREVLEERNRGHSLLDAIKAIEDRETREIDAARAARAAARAKARLEREQQAREARKAAEQKMLTELHRIATKRNGRQEPTTKSLPHSRKKRRKVSLVDSLRKFEKNLKRRQRDPVAYLRYSVDEWEQLAARGAMIDRDEAGAFSDAVKRAKKVVTAQDGHLIKRAQAVVSRLRHLGLLPHTPHVKIISTPMGGQTKQR